MNSVTRSIKHAIGIFAFATGNQVSLWKTKSVKVK